MSIPEEELVVENVNNSVESYAPPPPPPAHGFPRKDGNGSDDEDHFARKYACGPGNQY